MSDYQYRDGRFWKDGRPFFAVCSDYQYYRDRRDNWRDRLEKLKAAGVNVITFYTPWRHHLRFDDQGNRYYDFDGRTKDSRDVRTFLKLIEELGLLMIVKPGPFVHSELNVGGLPDLVCPQHNKEMPPARRHHGRACRWTYDNSELPAPLDKTFDALVAEYLGAVGREVAPFCRPGGPVIALQFNDETIYCMSNDPPWHIGYEPSGMAFYHQLLKDRYESIGQYNKLHGTAYPAWEFVPGPMLDVLGQPNCPSQPGPAKREDLLRYVDWAEYQWRLRRDAYVRYTEYMGIKLPFLTNYAGITPPIDENVPDLKDEAKEHLPSDYAKLYSEWWFAMNRVDTDLDVYEYGMISWLGVAAYDRDVFDRYINTARRARGVNMEENWGFGTLYDARSRDPIVPFFQTLASLAGGATGYDIFVGVSTDYWDDELDRITKLQCPTFPSHAPIDEHGRLRPMYDTMKMLNRWFLEHGEALLECEIEFDSCYLLYAPYAAVSSWVPDERYWHLAGRDIPRCGHQAFEAFSKSLQAAGYSFGMFELEAATPAKLHGAKSLALHSAFFMAEPEQKLLADFIASGGRLFISGELPEVDLQWQPCTILKDAVEKAAAAKSDKVVHRRENLFADGDFPKALAAAGIRPSLTHAPDMRAYIHRGEQDSFVYFFNFDTTGTHDKWIEFDGARLELRVGSKTSGVLRITAGKLTGWMVKAVNEVENITDTIRIRLGDQTVEGTGDFSSVAWK